MGTPKQAETLVKLHRQLGLKSWYLEPSDPIGSAQRLYDDVIASPHSAVQKEFKRINEATGFDRDVNPSTDAQRVLIAKLERLLFGRSKTASWSLTFGEADLKIKALKLQRDSTGLQGGAL